VKSSSSTRSTRIDLWSEFICEGYQGAYLRI
jgi:hypothetical protein